MAKVTIVPQQPEMRLPGSDDVIPPEGVEVELNAYWKRQAESGRVLVISTPPADARAGKADGKKDTGKKPDGGKK